MNIPYKVLVARIAEISGQSEEAVRQMFLALPEAIMGLASEGDFMRTPLGAIKIVRRPRKSVKTPDGVWSHAQEELRAKINPGLKLRRQINEGPQDPEKDPQDSMT